MELLKVSHLVTFTAQDGTEQTRRNTMHTKVDLAALCHEFTNALTEVLAEKLLVRHDVAGLLEHMLL
jgi:hypothetical protein